VPVDETAGPAPSGADRDPAPPRVADARADDGRWFPIVIDVVASVIATALIGAYTFLRDEALASPSVACIVLSGVAVLTGFALSAAAWRTSGDWRRFMIASWVALAVSVVAATGAFLLADGQGGQPSPPSTTSAPPVTTAPSTGGAGATAPSTDATTATTGAARSGCPDEAVHLSPRPVPDGLQVSIDVVCAPPEGRTYRLISQIDDIGLPVPHTEYYVQDQVVLDEAGAASFSWRFDGPDGYTRHLYVVSVTAEQDARLHDFDYPDQGLLLDLPSDVPVVSNTVDFTND
jgi:hypothetical protein